MANVCERTGAIYKGDSDEPLRCFGNGRFQRLAFRKNQIGICKPCIKCFGTVNPIEEIIKQAHAIGAKVLLDGAQAAPHIKADVQALDVDFYVTSAHKLCGPTGVGMLYGKETLLNMLPPYQGGGEMIAEVRFEKTTYADLTT